jgi:hypothetical protein
VKAVVETCCAEDDRTGGTNARGRDRAGRIDMHRTAAPWSALPRTRLVLLALTAALVLGGCRSDEVWISDEARQAQADAARYGPCTPTCRVPVYETVMEPVYEKRTTPVFKEYEVPVYKHEEETIYTTRYEPIEGYKTKQIMVRRKKPIKISFQGKCGMEEKTLYCVDDCVPIGVERVPATHGYRAVREPWGVKRVPVITGYRRVREPNGCKTECVQVGEKPVRRICGWKTVPASEARR